MSALLEVHRLQKRYAVATQSASGLGTWLHNLRRGPVRRDAHVQSFLHAVDDISFSIQEGESLGLVGESGCGKSTLVRLLTRLIEPTAGQIVFAGQNIGAIPVGLFGRLPQRAQIQVVFQDANDSLNPRHTAFDSIAEPLRRLAPVSGRQDLQQRVETLATQVGLPVELLGRFPHQLSGGQKARVNIARAIAVQPRLLILDEPTSALDVSVQAIILQLLAKLRRDLGLTYLFVSHDLNVVRLLCDRVMVMYLGKAVEIGPSDDVFTQPLHPYTRALISAIPSYERRQKRDQVALAGEPRSPIDPSPNVCRFDGRCPKSQTVCQQVMPALQAYRTNHAAACHFPTLA